MASRRNTKLRDSDKETSETPDRPNQIAAREGDPGEVIESIDLGGKKGKNSEVDINAPLRTDDARSDADKDRERQDKIDRDRTGGGDDDERPVRRRDEPQSKQVQRRVERERALRRRSDERVTNLTRKNAELENRLARIERAGNTDESAKTLKGITDKLAELRTELIKAKEAGDSTKEADIQMQIGDLQAEKKLIERDVEAAKSRKDETPNANERRGTETDNTDGPPEIVNDFVKANRSWWNMPSAKDLRTAAVEIDKLIKTEIEDGKLDFDEYSEEHMDELTVRLAKEAKKLGLDDVDVRDFNGDVYEPDEEEEEGSTTNDDATANDRRGREKDVNSRKERGAPQGGMGGREGRRGAQSDLELARQGRARLTEDDYSTMRVYGLNPNDEEHRKRFAKERVRTILTEAGKTAGRGTR